MKYTSTYLLNKPESSDSASITPISENMDTIDTQLKNLNTAVNLKADSASNNMRTYTSLEQIGLDSSATMDMVLTSLPNQSCIMFDSYASMEDLKPSSFSYCLTHVFKHNISRVEILCIMKEGGMAVGKLTSACLFDGWDIIPVGSGYVGYAECNTAAGTTAKVCEMSNFKLTAGALVQIQFNEGNTNSYSTLNVNGTGAKQIWLNGVRLDGSTILAGNIVQMVYDGTHYRIIAIDKATSSAQKPTLNGAGWEEIVTISQSGLAAEYWSIGDTKEVALSTGETLTVRIEGFDHDTCADGTKAGITFGLVAPLETTNQMHSSGSNSGGWSACNMRNTVMPAVFETLPSALQSVIKTVNKVTSVGTGSSTLSTTQDKLWLYSASEIGLEGVASSVAGEGTAYATYYSAARRKKVLAGGVVSWFTRSPAATSTSNYIYLTTSGASSTVLATSSSYYTVFGFCV